MHVPSLLVHKTYQVHNVSVLLVSRLLFGHEAKCFDGPTGRKKKKRPGSAAETGSVIITPNFGAANDR